MAYPEHCQVSGIRITPNILSVDFASLRHEIGRIPGADGVRVDVMDNHFALNLTVGLPVVECLHKVADQLLNIYLMIEDSDRWAPVYAEAGAESATFHVEAAYAPIRLARELRARGARALMALKPATPVEPYAEVFDESDMVLLMTVELGFDGQKFLDLALPKIRRARELTGDHPIWLQVDDGVLVGTIERCAEAGVNTFMADSAVCSVPDPGAMARELCELANSMQYC